ncbi:BapA prefix-like domain-containing protein, partial [Acinetobacter sp. YH16032]|uniref:BapA/Bap/LapF family prefix-like domain-containing protein n=1 Tax=Acinetobacter sp. YH16032 TaxID=2601181 RepID=UPI0015D1B516
MQTQIISKKTLNNTITSESNIIKIVEDSVVMIDVAPEDVQELIVNDNQVIIKLNNGETITLENFNYETSDLVFRNQNSEMFVLDFKNVEYNPLESIEALLEGGAGTGATILNNWLAGGSLALGAVGVGVAVFDAANGSSDTKQPSKDLSKLVDAINDAKNSLNQLDGDEKQRVENAINDAEAVLKDPESSQELLDQTADDLISIVEDALKDQEAKDAAKLEEAINNLEADLENAKDKLENEDPNDPYTDETRSELEKEIEEAQKLVDDFNNNIGDKPSIDDVNNARDELNNAVDNLTNLDFSAATQAVQTAEAKHDELVEAIAAKNGVISPATQAQLQAIKDQ